MAEPSLNVPVPKKVLIAGDDAAFVPMAKRHLTDLGIGIVTHVTDGKQAWDELDRGGYDLIVMNWQLAALSGIALFNRIRHDPRYTMVPVIACSSKVQLDDFRLLDEFPCSRLLEKPSTQGNFHKTIIAVIQEAEWYRKRRPYTEKLFAQAYHDPERVGKTIKQLLKDAPNPIPASLMVADILYNQGHFQQAEVVFRKVLAYSHDSIPALNGIGKVLYRRGKPEEAFTFLRIAWRRCEQNIERLCLLGELEIGQHDSKSAAQYFEQALKIDTSHEKAHAGVIICRNLDEYVQRNSTVGLPRSFASICNSVGISLIRNEKMDNGLAQYRAALNFLGEDSAASLVMFNIGLGYARWQKWNEAYEWFAKSAEKSPPQFNKSRRWVERLQPMLKQVSGERASTLIQFEDSQDGVVTRLSDDEFHMLQDDDVEVVDVDEGWFEDIYD